MTLHKLTAGNGYTYLTRQVAANDATEIGFANLGEYYSERGESPGVWLGHGLTGLEHGPVAGDHVQESQMIALFGQGRHPNADVLEQAVIAGGASAEAAVRVSALGRPYNIRSGSPEFRRELARRVAAHNREHGESVAAVLAAELRAELRTELGREWFLRDFGRAPTDGRELTDYITGAARVAAQPVAGYDLTFTPVKSVSALWALADADVAQQVAAAHHAAVRDALEWLERDATYTRLGHNGIRQVDVRGLLAVAFTHRDSRAGDPDLHTHVAISNKVQTLDGRWLALDGRPIHRAAVAASERYNTRLEAQLVARLGLRFAARPTTDGKRPVREIVGVDPALAEFWSKRRMAIVARKEALAAEFTRQHSRTPDFGEETRLFDRANTGTRQRKHAPRSELEQRRGWRQEAVSVLGDDGSVTAMLRHIGAVVRPLDNVHPVSDVDDRWVQWVARAAVATVAAKRSTWPAGVVRSEVERMARYGGVPLRAIDAVVEAAVALALSPKVSIRLGSPDVLDEPSALCRRDGSSEFAVAGSQLYTSDDTLQAESRILAAARCEDGRVLDARTIDVALLETRANGTALNDGQVELTRTLGLSGRRVQLSLAPAGSGKTTALGVLARAWADAGGHVVGLAPTGRSADQLRQAIGIPTDTVDKLLCSVANRAGPEWVDRIGRDTLVIVDEAGGVGTPDLDRLIAYVNGRGGSVRLVGDIGQLARPACGGVLRDIAETIGAAGLDTLVRYDDPLEGHASLGLRHGDPLALGYYLDHDRIHGGDRASMMDHALISWRRDRTAGKDVLLLAYTNDVVRQLNDQARQELLSLRGVTGPDVPLSDGTRAGAGDTVLTRSNSRRLLITATDWVKNGDRWFVDGVSARGGLRVSHLDTGRKITLPPSYVRRSVQLGYAMTIHLAQGSTADTCHAVLNGQEGREALYVAMSRGRTANHIYLDMGIGADEHAAVKPNAVRPPTSVEILERILANTSAPRSATTQQRLEQDPSVRVRQACGRYRSAVESVDPVYGGGDRPLPWLPAIPVVDDAAWSEYLRRRFDLVRDLAAQVNPDEVLPDAPWAGTLRGSDPELARVVAIWRVSHNVAPSDLRPCGALDPDDDHQAHLLAQVTAKVGPTYGPIDRWKPVVDRLVPGLATDPYWPDLAAAFDRAERAGYDVESALPRLMDQRPLPEQRVGRELYYRLGRECDAALAVIPDALVGESRPTPPPPLPAYAHSVGGHAVERRGPRR
jgi:conjugative relaxase-like TrwC/TraI family protein